MKIKIFMHKGLKHPILIVRRVAKRLGSRYQVKSFDGFTLYKGNDRAKALVSYTNGGLSV